MFGIRPGQPAPPPTTFVECAKCQKRWCVTPQTKPGAWFCSTCGEFLQEVPRPISPPPPPHPPAKGQVTVPRARQPSLFEVAARPRAKPRKLMHVVDAGCGHDDKDLCRFECKRCGHSSEWLLCSFSDAKRGIPCPQCNREDV